jgi:hypothetical protein
VAEIVDYDTVLQTLLGQGLKTLYYNSGSFGFPPGVATQTVAWIGPPDPTIRPEALSFTRQIGPPYTENLTRLALRAWGDLLPGVLWAMPRSHWAYELDFGSKDWMPPALAACGVNAAELAPLTTGAAIEFNWGNSGQFASFLKALLDNLSGSSDFQLVWPGKPVVCTVHHHKQLWWTTSDDATNQALTELPGRATTPPGAGGSA